jgi:hypothetical protein
VGGKGGGGGRGEKWTKTCMHIWIIKEKWKKNKIKNKKVTTSSLKIRKGGQVGRHLAKTMFQTKGVSKHTPNWHLLRASEVPGATGEF